MKSLPKNWSVTLSVLGCVLMGCLLAPGLRAGEAIQFSNSRSRLDPTAKSKLPTDLEGDRLGRVTPMDFIPQAESGRRDPARTRKEKNAALERANWMMLDKGQLDAKDEEKRSMGMREANFEKESDRKDYFFTPMNQKDGLAHSPFGRSGGKDRTESGGEGKEVPELAKPEETSDPRHTAVLGKDGQPLGEHTAKELDLKDLLNSGKANSLAPASDKTALMWKDVLGFADNARKREEGMTADNFRGQTPSGTSTKAGDPLNFRNDLRNDFSTRAALSSRASTLEGPRNNLNMGVPPAAPRAAEPVYSRGPSAYATPDPFGSAGGADPYAALRQPQPPPQRPISSGSAIPARPGYGR